MDSQTDKKDNQNVSEGFENSQASSIQTVKNFNLEESLEENLEDIIDENLITIKKVHSILLNCINLTKKQKLEFAESERYFMKMYLNKLANKIEKSEKESNSFRK